MKFYFAFLSLLITIVSNAQIEWKTFRPKNQYKIDLPTFFKDGGTTASGLHYFNNTRDELVTVCVEGEGRANSSTLTDYYLESAKDKSVSYKVFKPNWYVVSGFKDGEYYYSKAILKPNGDLYTLRITYPPTQKALFDLLLGRISRSFS
jgi:hypothetical protein